ncbi:DNA alkylation repair protein [Streptococcus parasanguinis]|jgi:DNA alkylation repair enzyme|uniref:DNA alkylation repair protein n=1 Tax=Streptococcus parasanguinis TaxID=1318 RepID=UPI0012BCFB12|nr:DNA alkylation repair protein [Streptococcus parasanguinis]MTR53729.1 DNA alkylation repair protein [Streptococcus parasanguinis]MTR55758.1 DNA alkylation repair protein [Streptococcus parasanguinis]MTR60582.1 DNA alkylation repair protein [Streptococcus parasanguinis]MTR70315.1 DNA alkylation repair protein [Streptococcus parasanguinis]MTS02311.1 DNA alkylation repair protein [Streptococcus parasanguinis]
MKIEDLIPILEAATVPEKIPDMEAYMKNKFSFLGVQKPILKKIEREFFKPFIKNPIDWAFVEECWQQPYREFQYIAMDYLDKKKKELRPEDFPKLKQLAQTKSWWDSIDQLDLIIGEITFHYPETKQVMLEWSKDQDFWLRRIAIDNQLMRKEKTDTDLLEKVILNNLGQSEFFINKAIGWSLRNYSKVNPDWVGAFIDRYREQLSPLSIREGSKYLPS